MSGTVLGHRLVRGYLRELDAAMRDLPAAAPRPADRGSAGPLAGPPARQAVAGECAQQHPMS